MRYQQRNLVALSFVLLKQWRGLATRRDTLAIVSRAAVVLSACITWIRHLGDMPKMTCRPRRR
ncbi:transposase [Mycobacterium sp. CBMA226]|nr:transposase [Mycolicibacterium sp. CBMA 226]